MFAYAGTGDKEQLLATIEAAYAQHATIITELKVGPAYDSVANEPRFQGLLRWVSDPHALFPLRSGPTRACRYINSLAV